MNESERPRVILLRGAPAVGKSTVAAAVIASLGRGAALEVDHLRGIQAGCDWHDRRQHLVALEVASATAGAFVAAGVTPVVVVDVFGRSSLRDMQARLDALGVSHMGISLWARSDVLQHRAQCRGDDPSGHAMAGLLNNEIRLARWTREALLDTSNLTQAEVVQFVLERSWWRVALHHQARAEQQGSAR